MNREEIIEASRCSACEMNCIDCGSYTTNRAQAVDSYGGSESVKCPFELGAEWMQEQKEAEIDELNDKVSELTEQLDAAHVFCAGVKEYYIKKACKLYKNEIEQFKGLANRLRRNGGSLIDVNGSVEVFKQVMEGE